MDDLLAEQRVTNTILRAAFKSNLEAIVKEIIEDSASSRAVVLLADGPKPAGGLSKAISSATNLKETAIRERLAPLVESGVILREGGGPATIYRLGHLLTNGQVAQIKSRVS